MYLSIIIPCYNSEKWISRCLDSILCQDIDDYELIVVNDGSEDDTLKLLSEYQAKYPDIIKIIDKANGGVSTARNAALDIAKGKYVAFVDSDDEIVEDRLHKVILDSKQFPGTDVFLLGMESETDGTILTKEYYDNLPNRLSTSEIVLHTMISTFPSPWAKLYRTELINQLGLRFPEGKHLYEDALFNHILFNYNPSVKIIKGPFYRYQMMPGSFSRRFFGQEVIDTVEQIRQIRIEYFKRQGMLVEAIDAINRDAAFVYLFAIYSIYRGRNVKHKYSWLKKYWNSAQAHDKMWTLQLDSGIPKVISCVGRISRPLCHIFLMSMFGLKKLVMKYKR